MNITNEQAQNSQYFSLIKELLLPDEKIALIASQIQIWPAVSLNSVIKPKIIFATNKRVIIIARPSLGLGRSISIFPYTIIRAIKITRGLRLYTISISHEGSVADTGTDEPSFVNGINHDDAMALEKYINEQIDALGPHDNQRNYVAQKSSGTSPEEARSGITCLNCGFLNDQSHDYCYHCGKKL